MRNAHGATRALLDDVLLQGHEDVRHTEVAVVLGDLVLENEVVAKRVPRELAREPMVLMKVGPGVREDQIRLRRLEFFEARLHLGAVVGKEALADAREFRDLGRVHALEKGMSLALASSARTPSAVSTTHVTDRF